MRNYSAEEKNGIVQSILNKVKKVKEIAEESVDSPSERTIRRWKKEYLSHGPFVDDNNNDAIPSWSGYSYQGKVAILCAVEKINNLFGHGVDEWKIQLEKLQDFVLIRGTEIDSLWQVKAKLSTVKYQSYITAMEKLLEDRKTSGFLNAECKLVTAVDIDNWEDKGNKYKGYIELYKHKNEIVPVKTVSCMIMEELQILINVQGITVDKESAYLYLCSLLDDKIADFHKAGKKDKYLIEFKEIIQRIKDTSLFEDRISRLRIKELIYQNISEKIVDGSKLYCEECPKTEDGTCDIKYCSINRYNELFGETDIENYMKSIRPEIEKDLDYTISHPGDYTDTIYYSINTAPAAALVKENNIISVSCYEGKLHAIPTMLDLSRGSGGRLSQILESVGKNEWLRSNIGERILLGNTQNEIFGTKLTKFTNIQLKDLLGNEGITNKRNIGIKYCVESTEGSKKTTKIPSNITIVDRKQVIDYFGEEDEDE